MSDQGDEKGASKVTKPSTDESGLEVKKVKSSKAKKGKPARVQVDPSTVREDDRPPQTGAIFNIWYLKWSGGDRDNGELSQRKADGRCNIARDSGYTKADQVPGSYFCLYFARGLCHNGKRCEYLHRLPTLSDMFSPNVDCFGRDKHTDYRDDMGGVGSFLKQNRTIYVARINTSYKNVEEVISRHFSEWGEIERIRVLNERGIAFVTYANETNAQFAKEAMAHQSLDLDEVLNVRWATDDPNPAAQAREKRRLDEQATEAIKALLPKEYVAELEMSDGTKRKRTEDQDSSYGLEGYSAPLKIQYATQKAEDVSDGKQESELVPDNSDDTPEAEPKSEQMAKSTGIFNQNTLDALKALSEAPKPMETPSLGLDYDSDS